MFAVHTRRLLAAVVLVLLSLGVTLPVAAAPTPCANLVITDFSVSPPSPIAGQLAQINFTVQNTGSCSTNVSFVVQWKQTQFSPTGPSTSVGPLAAGAAQSVSLPYTFAKGGNFLSVVTVDTNHAVAETNEIDNVAIQPVTVQNATTDLSIASFTVTPSPAVQGWDATATVVVQNTGNTDAGPFQVSWSPTLNTPPVTQEEPGLAAGASLPVTLLFNYPTVGTFLSSATVDATRQVSETNEFNNTAFTQVTVEPPLPDLIVSNIAFNPPNPIAGQTVHVTVTVSNIGHVSSGQNSTVSWAPAAKGLALSKQVGPIDAGNSIDVGFDYTYIKAGTFDTTATADSNGVITELHEDNNSLTQPVTVGGSTIDLTITNVVISPGSPTQGVAATATVYFSNTGNTDAGPFVISWNPDGNGVIVPGVGTLTQQVNGLAAGDSSSVTFTFTYPQFGAFHTVAKIDAFNTVLESNEANNLFTNDITVNPGNVDLVITQFDISPASPKRFDKVTATITVKNNGSLPVGYFAVEWKLSSTDVSGRTTWVAGLNPGESKTITITGLYFYAGSYTTQAIVDSTNRIVEPGAGESNNVWSQSITVQPLS